MINNNGFGKLVFDFSVDLGEVLVGPVALGLFMVGAMVWYVTSNGAVCRGTEAATTPGWALDKLQPVGDHLHSIVFQVYQANSSQIFPIGLYYTNLIQNDILNGLYGYSITKFQVIQLLNSAHDRDIDILNRYNTSSLSSFREWIVNTEAATDWLRKWYHSFPGRFDQCKHGHNVFTSHTGVDIEHLAAIVQFCIDTGAL